MSDDPYRTSVRDLVELERKVDGAIRDVRDLEAALREARAWRALSFVGALVAAAAAWALAR